MPAGTSLKTYTGPDTITTAGTVIDGADVRETLTITAANVVIRNSRISGTGYWGVYVRSGSLTIENSTIEGFENGLVGDNYSADGIEVTKLTSDGFKIGDNVVIQNSWCHDLAVAEGAHADCGQIQAGVSNAVIRGNWFDPGNPDGNAALFVAPDLGPSSPGPVRIESNTFGGGNYTVYIVDGDYGKYFISDISLTDNRFLGNARYGPLNINVPVKTSGNVLVTTGAGVG